MNNSLESFDLYEKSELFTQKPAVSPDIIALKDLNMEEELARVYAEARQFLSDVRLVDAPPNQVAQVFNTISSILKEITKTQTELYNSERLKRIEAAVVQAIKLAPKESQDVFFNEYEKLLDTKVHKDV